MTAKKLISIVTPCYNEEANVEELYRRVKEVFSKLEKYEYEHIFIDNSSTDGTVGVLKDIAKVDHRVRIIVNTRNFGGIRSSQYGLLQSRGDAVVLIWADLQGPPSLIPDFIRKWEDGYKVVKGIKTSSEEGFLLFSIRGLYYRLANKLSDVELDIHFDGFGLYDKKVIEILRTIDDPYPYFRGLVAELGFESASVEYKQALRKRGTSSYRSFYRLYDCAILGITSHSRVPLRLAIMFGFVMSFMTFLIAVSSLILKLIFWNYFPVGIAAIIVGVFSVFSIQLFFIGILGEYVGLMHMRILKRPLVIEKERINFENGPQA